MEILLWVIVIALFFLSFVALIFPILPSVTAVWAGFLVYHFFLNPTELGWFFWISMGVITIVLLLADIFTGSIAVKQFGGSKWGERIAAISIIIGSFIYPPFGIIFVPFIAVFIIEIWFQDTIGRAFKSAIGTLVGFLSGQFAEAVLQVIMIIWFFITIII